MSKDNAFIEELDYLMTKYQVGGVVYKVILSVIDKKLKVQEKQEGKLAVVRNDLVGLSFDYEGMGIDTTVEGSRT